MDKYIEYGADKTRIGVVKVISETELYYKIIIGSKLFLINKETMKSSNDIHGCSLFYFKLISESEAKVLMKKDFNISVLHSMRSEDWDMFSARELERLVTVIKEKGLCTAGKSWIEK